MQRSSRPKKIAIVYDVLYPWTIGGVEKRYWEIARRLPRYGLEPHLFGPKYWEGPRAIRRDGVWLHGVGTPRQLYAASGARAFSEPLLFARDLLPALLRFNADLIDCCAFPFFPWYSAKIVAELRGTPLLTTTPELWGKYWLSYLGPVRGTIARLIEYGTARLSRHEQCPSPFTARRLRAMVRESVTISAIPGGIDLGMLVRLSKPAALRQGVVVVGRLIRQKRVADAIEALGRIKDDHPGCNLTIIGRGPEEPRLRLLAHTFGVQDRVLFLCGLGEEALYTTIGGAQCLVLSSEREGQGLVVAEAQAAGTPPIVAVAPESAASDFVEDGVNGLLYPVGDVTRLAVALHCLLDSRETWDYFSSTARLSAAHLDWDTMIVPAIAALYTGMLETHEPRRGHRHG